MERVSKENYYLDIAETVIGRSTCLRRRYGAIIVKNDGPSRRCPGRSSRYTRAPWRTY